MSSFEPLGQDAQNEHAAGAMNAEKEEGQCCTRRVLIATLACCCCLWLTLAALGITAGVLYAAYQEPSVEVRNAMINDINFETNGLGSPTKFVMKMDVTLRVTNPSGSPIKAKARDIKLRFYSLDKTADDEVGTTYELGTAERDEEFEIDSESVTDVKIVLETDTAKLANPLLAPRFFRDCSIAGDAETRFKTKIRIHVQEATVTVFGIDVPLKEFPVDFLMSCNP